MEERTFVVPDMSCGHCKAVIEEEIARVAGVEAVEADPETKHVVVRGDADEAAIRAAIDEAGYEAA